ncbi:MAG: TonB-dependent receptor family protein [Gammaproteobacteria bacterium]
MSLRKTTQILTPSLAAALLLPLVATAAEPEVVEVRASRMGQTLANIAGAVSVVDEQDIQLGRQQFALDESLNRVPGMFSQNRYNFAQDLRISLRGFGARANFGIRGIRVFVDGIPSTVTDGQSVIDDVELGAIERVEVIRGPSSSLYGSSSGGVISLYTESGTPDPYAEARLTLGEFDQQKYHIKTGGEFDQLNYFMSASHLSYDGYRDHSEVRQTTFNSKFTYDINENSDLQVVFNAMDSPTREDPGALTLADAAADPRQAQVRNVSSNAGEDIDQQKLGFTYNYNLDNRHEITLRNYYIWRDFETFLPIGSHIPFVADDGVTGFDRFFFGGGAQYTFTGELFGRPNQVSIGVDVDSQTDDRQRYINNAGVKGALRFDQEEQADSVGVYIRNIFAVTDTLQLTVGGRYDSVELEVDDAFLANGNQSSKIDFDEFNPTVGLNWNAWGNINLFANYATSFETPTFTELANPARDLNVNLGGFANVQAQTADSFEFGMRGALTDRINVDVAYFTMQVDDEVTNVSNVGNRSFFENADTDRQGVETAAIINLFDGLRLTTAYTWSDFEFDKFITSPTDVGNDLPGIPEHQFYAELAYTHASGFYAAWDVIHVGKFYANNANTIEAGDHTVSNLRLGHEITVGQTRFGPYIGVNNLFDEEYFANVRLNAFGGRAFEPAPDINVYGGISARMSF